MSSIDVDLALLEERAQRTELVAVLGDDPVVVLDVEAARLLSIPRTRWRVLDRICGRAGGPITLDAADMDAVLAWALYFGSRANGDAAANTPPDQETITDIAFGAALDCNLACTYCYNGSHFDAAKIKGQRRMSADTVRKAVAGLHRLGLLGGKLKLSFFGGEPLLNPQLITASDDFMRAFGEEHGISFEIVLTTNGTKITPEFLEFATRRRVGISISLDGPKDIHDKNRPTRGGGSSYDTLEQGLRLFFDMYPAKNKSCRITIDGSSIDLLRCTQHAIDLGFTDIGMGFANDSIFGPHADAARNLETVKAGLRDVATLYEMRARSGTPFRFSLFNDVLSTLHHGSGRTLPCKASRGYLAVSPDGSIVPCHRYLGGRTRIVGSVESMEAGTLAQAVGDLQAQFVRNTNVPKCQTCWARRLCGGECFEVKDGLLASGVQQDDLCEVRYAVYREAIGVYARMLASDRAALDALIAL